MDKLDVRNTVNLIQPLDYSLNRIAEATHSCGHFGSHAIQAFSYITHPIDIGIQAIAYPILELADPFIDVGINLANKQWQKAAFEGLIIPLKLCIGIVKTLGFEISQLSRLGWSIIGANALMNIYKGEKQSESFFVKRLFNAHESETITGGIKRARHLAPYIKPFANSRIQDKYEQEVAAIEEMRQAKIQEARKEEEKRKKLLEEIKAGTASLGVAETT